MMSINHSWIGPCASCAYCTLVTGGGGDGGGGGESVCRGGALQLGQPMDPLAQEPDRMDEWMDDKFIWHISYPKATASASQITRANK